MCGRFGRKSRLQGRRRGQAHFLWRKLTAIFEARTKLSEAEAKSIEEDRFTADRPEAGGELG
jgi:hypothetical protein